MYYFVSWDGFITTEDNCRGWYDTKNNQEIFTNKRKAVAEAKRRLKARIAELQAELEALNGSP